MKVTFFCCSYESLGVEYISASLKKAGHQANLSFDPSLFNKFYYTNDFLYHLFSYKNIVIKQVIDSHPDIVGFSVVSDTYGWACEIAREIKKRMDVPVVFGGIHPTSVPEIVIQEDFVDYVCIGEGEEAMVELAEAIEKGKDTTNIKNIWAKKDGRVIENHLRPLSSNLDSLPFPDKRLFYEEYGGFSKIYSIITSRGCPNSCSYCHNNFLKRLYENNGFYYRRRSVDNVIEELRQAKQDFSVKQVYFIEDFFLCDLIWLREFSRKYRKFVGLPFICAVHPAYINQETVSLLESAGCTELSMGIQTISEELRKQSLLRSVTNAEIKSAIELLRHRRIFVNVDVILGIPGQDEEELLNIAGFLSRSRPDAAIVFPLRYYPRTDIMVIAGLDNRDVEKIEKTGSLLFKGNKLIPATKVERLTALILASVTLPPFLVRKIISKRLYNYFPHLFNLFLRSASLFMAVKKLIFQGKRKLALFWLRLEIEYYFYYICKKIFRLA